jgi:spermidine synthase
MRPPSSPFFSIALLGWVVATGQTILLREAVAVCQGNEMAIALALGQWLLLTAGGSALAGLCAPRRARGLLQVGALLLGPALGLALLTARGLPRLFGILPGALLTLDQQVLGLSLMLAPVCLLGGASFTWATRLQGVVAASAYLAEAVGWLVGGVTATWLLPTWHPFAIFALLAWGAVVAAAILSGPRMAFLAVGLALLLPFGRSGVTALERISLAWRWPGETLVSSTNTRYGHVVVLARGTEHALFVDGHLAVVLPEPQSSQELVHLALAQVSQPDRIFVWSGLGGLLPEILKHPVREVTMAEPDAALAELEIQVADPATRAALRDPRVRLEIGDVRNLMRRSVSAWDAVLLSTAEPSTLLAARVLTQESFAEIRRALRPGGVLAFALSGAENYYPADLVARNGAVWKPLSANFAHVMATPLSTNYFLASAAPLLTDAATLARRLDTRKVFGAFVDEASLDALMPSDRMHELGERYRTAHVVAASDRQPTAYRYSLAIAGRADAGNIARLVPKLMTIPWWPIAGLVALGLLVLGLLGRRTKGSVVGAVSTIGFASMGSTVLILVVAQSAVGALHHFLGALLAAHMAGLALAGWTSWPHPRLVVAAGPALAVPMFIPVLSRAAALVPAPLIVASLLLASVLAGISVGWAFRSAVGQGVGPAAAYVADLLGAALAAPIMALIALPGLGLDASAGLLAFLVVPSVIASKIVPSARLPM